jgi:membrane-associated phospholipid phosphatase
VASKPAWRSLSRRRGDYSWLRWSWQVDAHPRRHSHRILITKGILKPLIGRLRYGHLTFPSGHLTAMAAIAIPTAILLTGAQQPRRTTKQARPFTL